MIVSIEVPVIRGGWLIQCVDSVLQQTSSNWTLSLLWDEGDALSHEILAAIRAAAHPRLQVHFGARLGIARARQFLTERSRGDLVLPLDDDDVLEPAAVSRFLAVAAERPWAGIIRARRGFIDDQGEPIEMDDWFPFENRHYSQGATVDIANHAQPYAIRRSLFTGGAGWSGFEDYEFFGEDCSCFARVEEFAEIELLDETLYRYRIHGNRTSLRFSQAGANELWRRIADDAAQRRGCVVRRINDTPPFRYAKIDTRRPSISQVEAVVPFWETNEREVRCGPARPSGGEACGQFALRSDTNFSQTYEPPAGPFHRLELALSTTGSVDGRLSVALYPDARSFSPSAVLARDIRIGAARDFEMVSVPADADVIDHGRVGRIEIMFEPSASCRELVLLHTIRQDGREAALMRCFQPDPGHCRRGLERCLASLESAGLKPDSVHVIDKRQPSSVNRNELFRQCSKPWICFMDDDAELDAPDTLQRLLDALNDTGASMCGPKLLTPSREIYSGAPFTNPLTLEARVAGMGAPDTGEYDVLALVPWLPSTVLLVHRSVMLSTGGFDESYAGSQHEDVDFCFRARSRGFQCCYNGRAVAVHHNELRNGHFSANAAYFRSRWRNRPDLFASAPALMRSPAAQADRRFIMYAD